MNAAQSRHISDQSHAVVNDALGCLPEKERNAMYGQVMACVVDPQLMRVASDQVLVAVSIFAALGLAEQYAQEKNRGDA